MLAEPPRDGPTTAPRTHWQLQTPPLWCRGMSRKRRQSLEIDHPLRNLPMDWRKRVERVVLQVGKAFDLYVTSVQVGERTEPRGLRLSIAREGAEEVWTPKVVMALRRRILDELEAARKDEVERQVKRLGFDRPVSMMTFMDATRVAAVERPWEGSEAEKSARAARRSIVRVELQKCLAEHELPSQARDLVDIALTCMRDDSRWSLWARILLLVEEVEAGIPGDLQQRTRGLF
jgi:hypothetical protein